MIAVCVVCREPKEPWKFFEAGPACRSCVLTATTIDAYYRINGATYVERLKVEAPAVAPVIRLVKKERPR